MSRSKKQLHQALYRHSTHDLELPERGLRLGIVADTHSKPHPNAMALLKAQAPDVVLHAGDVGDLKVLEPLEKMAPLFVVRGNIDTRAHHLDDTITLNAQSQTAGLRILLTHIAIARSKLRGDIRDLARREEADMVICGHSHVPFISRDGNIAVFNPGSIGPRRFRLPITFGMAEISPRGVSLWHINCETGERWTP